MLKLLLCFNLVVTHAQQKPPDSVVQAASSKYLNYSILQTIFIGNNYRKEWMTPVKLPVFNLKTEQGGFTILEAGGGRQTNNLRLEDKDGNEWVLRSVDKDVEKSMTPILRNTKVEMLMQDLLSASHPYGALTVPVLADAIGVIVPKPTVFFIPDDTAFGEHRTSFANTVCYLEEREPTPDRSDTKGTTTLMEKVLGKSNHLLLQREILKARLLDMLIADWDRHGDQWRWGEKDSLGKTFYYPIPRDRDFAFFRSDGLFVKLVSITSLPYMWGFTNKEMALKKLNAKISYIDAQWLNELTAEDWENAISLVQKNITDSVIEKAVRKLPAEIYSLSGRNLAQKLKNRRDGLMKQGMRYYRFLAATPFIIGCEQQDFVTIDSEERGILVTISRKNGDDKNAIVYRRKFNPHHTKKIFIRGLSGNDHFKIDEKVSSRIKLQLEGGEGNDVYTVRGRIKTRIGDTDSTTRIVFARK
jgi:hypothetical protein